MMVTIAQKSYFCVNIDILSKKLGISNVFNFPPPLDFHCVAPKTASGPHGELATHMAAVQVVFIPRVATNKLYNQVTHNVSWRQVRPVHAGD